MTGAHLPGASVSRMLWTALLVGLAMLILPSARARADGPQLATIVIDAGSGRVLSAMDADSPRYPASLTKLMTLYLVFEALRDHRISLNDEVPVSAHAASMVPTKLGLVPGTHITVQQAILGLVTLSANDAASALGEFLGGTEARFGQMMTLRAHALGMRNTVFRNASGLPDPYQVTTARDMAILARHLIRDFPGFYHYFSTPSFVFHGRLIANHDYLLKSYPGADGLKTGYTNAAGHNLVTSAVHGNVRLIGVVLGAHSNLQRQRDMVALLNNGFDEMDAGTVVAQGRNAPRLPLISAAHAATPPDTPRADTSRPEMRLAMARTVVRPTPHGTTAGTRWGVQVGSFRSSATARRAAVQARHAFDVGSPHVERIVVRHRPMYRAQLTGLSHAQATNTCAVRSHKRRPCLLLRPEAGEVASR